MGQRLQWMQRSAFSLKSSAPQSRGSIAPAATWRTRLALARGVAASVRSARKVGHIRRVGSRERQTPQPLHAVAVSAGPRSGQRRTGSRIGSTVTGSADGSGGPGGILRKLRVIR